MSYVIQHKPSGKYVARKGVKGADSNQLTDDINSAQLYANPSVAKSPLAWYKSFWYEGRGRRAGAPQDFVWSIVKVELTAVRVEKEYSWDDINNLKWMR